MTNCRLTRQEFTRLMAGLCSLHRIAFSPELLHQHFPPDDEGGYDWKRFLDAAGRFGLSYERIQSDRLKSGSTPVFPLVAFPLSDSPDGVASTDTSPVLILGEPNGQVRCLSSGAEPTQPPDTESLEALCQRCHPVAWSFLRATDSPPADDEPGLQHDKGGHFGFRWFVPELLRHRKVWRDVLLASLALQLVGLSTPIFTQVIIDKVIVHQTQSTLIAVGVGLFIALIFSSAFTWIRQYLVLHTGNRIDAVLGSRVLNHLFRLPLSYFQHRPTGTLVARINGIETIREFISGAAISLLLDLPFMAILLAVMFWYSWQLTLITLSLMLLLAMLSFVVTPVYRHRLNQQFLLGARNQAFVTEYISGMETVKSLQLEPQLDQRYGGFLASYLASSLDTRQVSNTYGTLASALEQMQSLAILVIGATLVMNSQGFTIGMLVAFQMFAGRLSQPLLRLVGLYQEFQQANLAVKRLGDLMDAPTEPYALHASRTSRPAGRIELEGVGFRYSEHHPRLFHELCLIFQAGQTTVITGPSGSGKSTLTKLLLNFYRPQEGRILLGDQDIRHLSANELRQHFGVVPQETVLFAGTIYENLQIANPGADFPEITAACRLAEIHETIESLPNGYQTEIGEHGSGLSGGQKQRIAIARALLKHPKILIFDEATANLDQQTTHQIASTINKLRGKITILFIAHQIPPKLQIDAFVNLAKTGQQSVAENPDMEMVKNEA
jgi:subfamily B ATP-binding cassette protein HlyB/CyaB